ncbi:GDP-L-fucose synthase [Methylopila capsulata]|uniref:GDP-L-fucose synthase n=1 Tax=Methylopila capsulata TaxID=61654 RepID=A0A9W6IRM2_9HYPH|nr:GDP-L-fucose synthase [Methylopila capsulata]MBM7849956.1 GDP-L-fucose synthase [Methylopila capsulata]GLK55247.1 GDP-L-fucose synthase [Methylopila capsulata]
MADALPSPPRSFELRGKRIFVVGHRGMVGTALMRRLAREDCELLTVDRAALDLRRQADVERWMARCRPDGVIVAAARVGGIAANACEPYEFLYDNLMIGANLIAAAAAADVEKLLFLGSSCIYPRLAEQPVREDQLLTGPLEPTNEAYAIAKIAALMLARSLNVEHGRRFVTAMPTNLYGPGDNFDPASSHVLPALMRRIHAAKEAGDAAVTIWGSGAPLREFLHVDDLAEACVLVLRRYDEAVHINIGSGEEVSIRQLGETIADVVGYRGAFVFDRSKPDGAPRKLLAADRIRALGWRPRITLAEGIAAIYPLWLRPSHGSRAQAPA